MSFEQQPHVIKVTTRTEEARKNAVQLLRTLPDHADRSMRVETTDGALLAQTDQGNVVLHRETCRRVLGEDV